MFDEKLFLTLGYVLFCIGAMLGIPHGMSKGRGNAANTELWRVAHLSTCIGGISIIALVYALEIILPRTWVYALVGFSISAYFFSIACTLSGATNLSWFGDRKKKMAKMIYGIHIIASCLSVVVVIGTLVALVVSTWFYP